MTWEKILKIKTLTDEQGEYKVADLYNAKEFGDIVHSDLNRPQNMEKFRTISFDGNHPHIGGAHQYYKPSYTKSAVCMRCMVRINPYGN
tara:strand:- start:2919 stop:3185 length:267 start_codon:yes stop_codon:yes gene_type:complete